MKKNLSYLLLLTFSLLIAQPSFACTISSDDDEMLTVGDYIPGAFQEQFKPVYKQWNMEKENFEKLSEELFSLEPTLDENKKELVSLYPILKSLYECLLDGADAFDNFNIDCLKDTNRVQSLKGIQYIEIFHSKQIIGSYDLKSAKLQLEVNEVLSKLIGLIKGNITIESVFSWVLKGRNSFYEVLSEQNKHPYIMHTLDPGYLRSLPGASEESDIVNKMGFDELVSQYQTKERILWFLYQRSNKNKFDDETNKLLEKFVTLQPKLNSDGELDDWGTPAEMVLKGGVRGAEGTDLCQERLLEEKEREQKRLLEEKERARRLEIASASFLVGTIADPKKKPPSRGKKKRKKKKKKKKNKLQQDSSPETATQPNIEVEPVIKKAPLIEGEQKKKTVSSYSKKFVPGHVRLEDLDLSSSEDEEMETPVMNRENLKDETRVEKLATPSRSKRKYVFEEDDKGLKKVFVHPRHIRIMLPQIMESPLTDQQKKYNKSRLSDNDGRVIEHIFNNRLKKFSYDKIVNLWESFGFIKGGKTTGSHIALYVNLAPESKSKKTNKLLNQALVAKPETRKLGETFRPHDSGRFGKKATENLQSALWFAGVAPDWVIFE